MTAGEAFAAARGSRVGGPGPVHLNVGFDDPLVPDDLGWLPRPALPAASSTAPEEPATTVIEVGPATVVIAGDGAGPAARELAQAAGWPLLAEPTSGSRSGSSLVSVYRLLVGGELGSAVERVVVFGRPTLSRPVTALLARSDIELVVVSGTGRAPIDPGRSARHISGAVCVAHQDEPAWLASWLAAGERAAQAVVSVLDDERSAMATLSGYDVAAAVISHTGTDTGLVISASNPIRDADLAAGPIEAAFAVANRGLSGIDGTLSTAAGASFGAGGPGGPMPVRVLVGDLAFLHDTNALLLGASEPRPRVQVVVVNDGGGGIFGLLEHGEDRFAATLTRVFATPQQVDLAALCAAHRVAHQLVGTHDELAAALTGPPAPGISVVEVAIRRDRERLLARRLSDAVAARL